MHYKANGQATQETIDVISIMLLKEENVLYF